ncbi:hypothetical protein [Saccharicrinis aurantiacus]|uniref:hypothetical protein n=1 Tax=Saccharicrinis aurantiacus TaxID=1849719 RepID=UPI0008395108|nr:hypothetical protein [Saccharicrinis aurantiacus]
MSKLAKIITYILFALIAVSAVFVVMLFTGGEVVGETYYTPVYTDNFLNWAKFLAAGAAVLTLLFEVYHVIVSPKNAARSLISIAILAVIALVSYSLADDTALQLGGYEGTDNVPSMLKMTGGFMYSTYILLGGVIVSIIVAEVSKMVK